MIALSLLVLLALVRPDIFATWWSAPLVAAVYLGAMVVLAGRATEVDSRRVERLRYREALRGKRP
jgi:hypothetical protein